MSSCIARPVHHILLMQYGTASGIVQHSSALHPRMNINDSRGAPECHHCRILSSIVRADYGKEAFSSFLNQVCAFLFANCGEPYRSTRILEEKRTPPVGASTQCEHVHGRMPRSGYHEPLVCPNSQQIRKRVLSGKIRGKVQGRHLGWANDSPSFDLSGRADSRFGWCRDQKALSQPQGQTKNADL